MVPSHQVLQLVFQEEVSPDSSSAKRSQTTGHLVITMPKARQTIRAKKPNTHKPQSDKTGEPKKTAQQSHKPERADQAEVGSEEAAMDKLVTSTELLEVDPSVRKGGADFANIVKDEEGAPASQFETKAPQNQGVADRPRVVSNDFVDDPDIPPLI